MKLADLVREDSIVLDFEAADKWKAIDRLVDHLVAAGRVKASQKKIVHDALVAREKIASTGMEHGVALPHAQVEGLDEAAAALAIAPKGVPFACVDKKPATLIALLVIPRRSIKQHVRTLAAIARLLSSAEMRATLLASKSAKEAAETMAREEAKEFA
jgi:mannitol/fructose-specific phosphotransferase system IIA component (Ntr-type)